jgi:hypothetical protein
VTDIKCLIYDDGKVPCLALLWWASLVVASICFYLQASIIAQTKESISIDNVQLLTIASRGAEIYCLVAHACPGWQIRVSVLLVKLTSPAHYNRHTTAERYYI